MFLLIKINILQYTVESKTLYELNKFFVKSKIQTLNISYVNLVFPGIKGQRSELKVWMNLRKSPKVADLLFSYTIKTYFFFISFVQLFDLKLIFWFTVKSKILYRVCKWGHFERAKPILKMLQISEEGTMLATGLISF